MFSLRLTEIISPTAVQECIPSGDSLCSSLFAAGWNPDGAALAHVAVPLGLPSACERCPASRSPTHHRCPQALSRCFRKMNPSPKPSGSVPLCCRSRTSTAAGREGASCPSQLGARLLLESQLLRNAVRIPH